MPSPRTSTFATCPTLLDDGDLLVVNDTKVIPARLRLHRETGGAAEVLLLEPLSDDRRTWEAMIRPARKLRVGEQLVDADGEAVMVEIGRRMPAGDTWTVTIVADGDPLDLLQRHGEMPLPPYISDGARPSPTATRRCTPPSRRRRPRRPPGCTSRPSCWPRSTARGVEVAKVELVVGLDTFKPVVVDDPSSARDAQRALSGARPT